MRDDDDDGDADELIFRIAMACWRDGAGTKRALATSEFVSSVAEAASCQQRRSLHLLRRALIEWSPWVSGKR